MQTEISKTEHGANIMGLIEFKAEELRKREPSLTKEMASAKIYTAPENRDLRAAERWCYGFHESKAAELGIETISEEDGLKLSRQEG
jgi:hypothetical protein